MSSPGYKNTSPIMGLAFDRQLIISPATSPNLNLAQTYSKYWKEPVQPGQEDIVVIHVCDENRNISRDFCCKRDILVQYMKYFENFLSENENGYDDIDISVHCDVEIFEWLMGYIHEPNISPVLEKSMVVSILISSEFLQMDSLVDICIQHISNNLTEIIKLPIDLSCISEKLINKLAFITPPKVVHNYNVLCKVSIVRHPHPSTVHAHRC